MQKTLRRNDGAFTGSNGIDEKLFLVIGRDYFKTILPLIDNANISISILMFHWAFYPKDLSCEISLINASLLKAKNRGVRVRVYCSMPASFKKLKELGFDVRMYKGSGVMHAKALIFDSSIAVFGSHNFSQRAMLFNKEVSLVTDNKPVVLHLERYFESLWRNHI